MVLSIPDDEIAQQVVRGLRGMNKNAAIVVRCRYQGNIGRLTNAGANAVISEEAVASDALLGWCERFVRAMQDSINQDTVEGEED